MVADMNAGRTPSPPVEVRRSPRRRRTVTAYRQGDRIVVLVPQWMSATDERKTVDRMVERVLAREARRAGSGDDDGLAERARALSERYLRDQAGRPPSPSSVTWVSNQNKRWGSCTTTTGAIRLSDRLRRMPDWVVDYVLLHELAHLLVAEHSPQFWRLVEQYSLAARAKGYLEGFQAGLGLSEGGDAD
jgi:predicted metal-dependent hydrolase